MDYYIICQDERVINFAEPIAGIALDKNAMKKKQRETIDEMPMQFYIKEKQENQYIDYIEKPIPLVSDKLKTIMENFQEDTFYRPVVLADIKRMKQDLYWNIVPKAVSCLSNKSEFNKNGTLKKLIIDESKIGFNKIFKIDGILEEFTVLSLDLAEAILRRDFTGIKFKKIEKQY
ncbi:imm11 family protein [Clostridium sp. DJ247]|uniref:imm11 family protein n=1 Tax=Clostridium sp. DJ247 TaxID=2726188 RepID=UPI0016282DD9|nr:DUF1629 domain-containing protein [Clostridium sp. DJ247]MBC2580533.1 serine protease [Clostridium sp. DJ247]